MGIEDYMSALYSDVEKNPDDWVVRSIFADWCEDNGRGEAECVRWLVDNRKRPYLMPGTGTTATWFNARAVEPGLGDPESDIPEELYKALSGGEEQANHRTFRSLKEAEKALWDAWVRIRAGGWKPVQE